MSICDCTFPDMLLDSAKDFKALGATLHETASDGGSVTGDDMEHILRKEVCG